MRTPNFALLGLVGLGLTLSGCARLTSIHRSNDLPGDRAHMVSIDAKQRGVFTSPEDAKIRFCAEPPPDVFSALAASLSADASLAKGTSPSTAASVAAALSENASTIERTQTVNVLREAMFRNCERYLSGAITKDEFIVQGARDHQLIIQVMAIEQLTGAAKAQATAITTSAKAAGAGVTEKALELLGAAKKDLDAKKKSVETFTTESVALVPAGACPAEPVNTTTPPAGVTADQAKAKNDKCTALAAAKKQEGEAQKYYDTLMLAIQRQGELSAEASGDSSSAASSAQAASNDLASRVVEIVKQNAAFDEMGMTCVVWVRNHPERELPPYCERLLNQMAATEQAKLRSVELVELHEQAAVRMRFEGLQQALAPSADTVFQFITQDPAKQQARFDAVTATLNPSDAKSLRAALTSSAAFRQAFGRLGTTEQSNVLAAVAAANPN